MKQTEKETMEWLQVPDSIVNNYHLRQFGEANRSTVRFCDWLEEIGLLSASGDRRILDLGAGFGANVHYMAKRYPAVQFTGVELNPTFAAMGDTALRDRGLTNASMECGDLYDLASGHAGRYDGVVSYQLLSWLPEYSEPIKRMAALRPQWIAMTSLFYDGPVNTTIRTEDYTLPTGGQRFRESYYNIYALHLVRELCGQLGFGRFRFMPFEIDIDLAKPGDGGMRSYTERLPNGNRQQRAGPLLLDWYFVAASRE